MSSAAAENRAIHAQTIVSHFRGKVVSWDVVNEALADDGEPTMGNGLRSTVFSQKMGLSFIDQAFINARAVDPQVDLYYNDYNIEAGGQKTQNMLALVDGMRSRGVPITGVGFQMHVSIDWPSISAIESSLKAARHRCRLPAGGARCAACRYHRLGGVGLRQLDQ